MLDRMRRPALSGPKGKKMDFCAALEQAIAQAPSSEAAVELQKMLEKCQKGDNGGVTTQGGGGGTTNPPEPPKKS